MSKIDDYEFKREKSDPCLRYFLQLLYVAHPERVCLPEGEMLSEVRRFVHPPWVIYDGSSFVLKEDWLVKVAYEFGNDFTPKYFDLSEIEETYKNWIIDNLGKLSSLRGVDRVANVCVFEAAHLYTSVLEPFCMFVHQHLLSDYPDSDRFWLSPRLIAAAYGLKVKRSEKALAKHEMYFTGYGGKPRLRVPAKNFFTQALNAEKQFFENRPDLNKWAESIKDVYTTATLNPPNPVLVYTADCTPNEELPLQIEFSENVWFFLDRMVYCVENSPGFYQGLYRILNYIELFGWGKPTVVSWYKEFEAACCGAGHYTFIQMRRHGMFIFDETPWAIDEVKRRRKIADKQKKDILF